ncbi:hypothetical protein NP233_g7138 [Leucocoprinus birnbaumii]|uniref:Uncharacterized protein n=1 Tax=Leucocoprinus birnbaumii TaxID=56174 RepID=A0AAD5VV97_9AGAR|nr:hypothetical protein NP233_g7138 [Leucocoprinus birnbaumii]
MRLQHNIEPPAPGRGGNRKRKRGPEESSSTMQSGNQSSFPPSSGPAGPSGFSTFKVEPRTPSELLDDHVPFSQYPRNSDAQLDTNGRPRRSPSPNDHHILSTYTSVPFPSRGYTNGNSEESDPSADSLPDYLAQQIDPKTGLIKGRTPAMVMYLLMKARHRYASEQHDILQEELKATRQELRRLRDEKEKALDDVLRLCFGPEADQYCTPIQDPDMMPSAFAPPTPSRDLGYTVPVLPLPALLRRISSRYTAIWRKTFAWLDSHLNVLSRSEPQGKSSYIRERSFVRMKCAERTGSALQSPPLIGWTIQDTTSRPNMWPQGKCSNTVTMENGWSNSEFKDT